MVRKGQLVKPLEDSCSPMLIHWPRPYVPGIIVKGPYEKAFTDSISGIRATHLMSCVDVLLSNGDIILMCCKDLERA